MRFSLILACPVSWHCADKVNPCEDEIERIYVEHGFPRPFTDPIGQADQASELRLGLYEAFNEGIGQATGDVVSLLHVDDSLAYAEVLDDVALTLDQTGADAVYGDLAYVAQDDPSRLLRYWQSGHWAPENLACGWVPPLPAFFARREIYERAKGRDGRYFNTASTLDPGYELLVRMLAKMRISIAYLPELLTKIPVASPSNQVLASMICQGRIISG